MLIGQLELCWPPQPQPQPQPGHALDPAHHQLSSWLLPGHEFVHETCPWLGSPCPVTFPSLLPAPLSLQRLGHTDGQSTPA